MPIYLALVVIKRICRKRKKSLNANILGFSQIQILNFALSDFSLNANILGFSPNENKKKEIVVLSLNANILGFSLF